MHLKLIRKTLTRRYTEGELYIDNQYFCDTLERTFDRYLSYHPGTSCAIPPGDYRIIIAQSHHFKQPMPTVLGVPGRTGILIHPGNNIFDTRGCILVGTRIREAFITHSQDTFALLFAKLQEASKRHEEVKIEVGNG